MAIQFISHNLAVVSEIAHEIIVMYAGRIVERAPAEALFATPLHPYTLGLIATLPDPARRSAVLPVIPGGVPDLDVRPPAAASPIAARAPTPLPRRGAGAGGTWRRRTSSPASRCGRMTPLIALDDISVQFPAGRRHV